MGGRGFRMSSTLYLCCLAWSRHWWPIRSRADVQSVGIFRTFIIGPGIAALHRSPAKVNPHIQCHCSTCGIDSIVGMEPTFFTASSIFKVRDINMRWYPSHDHGLTKKYTPRCENQVRSGPSSNIIIYTDSSCCSELFDPDVLTYLHSLTNSSAKFT